MKTETIMDDGTEFLNHWLDFAGHPINTVKDLRRTDDMTDGKYTGAKDVYGELVRRLKSAAFFGIIIFFFGRVFWAGEGKPEVVSVLAAVDPVLAAESDSRLLLAALDASLLPFAVLLAVVIGTAIFHALAWLAVGLQRIRVPGDRNVRGGPHLGGTLTDSINAALAAGAFFLPLIALAEAGVLFVEHFFIAVGDFVLMVLAVALFTVWLLYFAAALSATHPNTTRFEAAATVGAAMVFVGTVFWALDFQKALWLPWLLL